MPSRSFVSKAICILQTTPHPYSEAPSSPSECAFQKVAALHSWRHSAGVGCVSNCSVFSSAA